LELRVWSLEFRVWSLEFGVWSLEFGVWSLKRLVKILTVFLFFVCGRSVLAQDTTAVSLLFVGDIMQHESQMKSAYDDSTGVYEYDSTFAPIKSSLLSADITIGNLELTLGGKPYTGYPAFSAPDELLSTLRDVGFDVLVTANNHSVDKGKKGLERTIRLLDSIGIRHTGTFRDTLEYLNEYPLILDKNNIRIALLNYTYGTNGIKVRPPNLVNLIDTLQIAADLDKAKAKHADVSIVYFHWGDEYTSMPNDFQKMLAVYCFSKGANLVIGSHPHVLQPMIWNKDTDQLVVYSLGNFISGQRARYKNGGAMVEVSLQKVDSKTRIASATYSLAWVYRASNKRRSFYLVPVTERTDTSRVHGPNSKLLMKEFIDDSRAFLQRENQGVTERTPNKKH